MSSLQKAAGSMAATSAASSSKYPPTLNKTKSPKPAGNGAFESSFGGLDFSELGGGLVVPSKSASAALLEARRREAQKREVLEREDRNFQFAIQSRRRAADADDDDVSPKTGSALLASTLCTMHATDETEQRIIRKKSKLAKKQSHKTTTATTKKNSFSVKKKGRRTKY